MNNTDKTEHTALPWKVCKYNPTCIKSLEGECIATTKFESWNILKKYGELEKAKDRARLIVTAHNSYHKDQEAIEIAVMVKEAFETRPTIICSKCKSDNLAYGNTAKAYITECRECGETDEQEWMPERILWLELRELLTKHQQGEDQC